MNEELQNTANEVLRGILENAASAKEFILSQTPDVVSQLLWWKGVESGIFFLLGAIILTFGAKIYFELFKNSKKVDWDDGWICSKYIVVGPVCVTLGLIFSLSNLEWLQILIAPKLYLLEYAASLVN